MKAIDLPVDERMACERYTSEKVFEQRYLKANQYTYEFFGLEPDAYKQMRATGVWEPKLTREKPDFWLPQQRQLYECIGCRGDVVRLRVSKVPSMSYWMHKLDAEGFFAIYNSATDCGYVVSYLDMIIGISAQATKIIQKENAYLYVVRLTDLGVNE